MGRPPEAHSTGRPRSGRRAGERGPREAVQEPSFAPVPMERLHLWHPLFVHFTVGLLTISVALYFLARFVKSGAWRERFTIAANLNLWIGALITALTVGAGMIAFGAAPHSDDIEYLMKT